jgi:hypothetical protein
MNRSTLLLITALIGILTVYALAQWQVQPQIDPRVGPIYPENPSYNFQSRSNYDPYQFNWYTGRWDYYPIPPNSAASSGQNWQYSPPPAPPGAAGSYIYGGPPANTPAPQSSTPSPTQIQPNIPPAPTPDDSSMWVSVPTTRPSSTQDMKPVTFEGIIIAIKAADLVGEATPHLLMRLRNSAGAVGTVDVGEKLMFPEGTFDANSRGHITATGQLGVLDGHLVLFAQQITIGKTTIQVPRSPAPGPQH